MMQYHSSESVNNDDGNADSSRLLTASVGVLVDSASELVV